MGLSAPGWPGQVMLVEEYILIVPFAYRPHHGVTCLRNIFENNSAVLKFNNDCLYFIPNEFLHYNPPAN